MPFTPNAPAFLFENYTRNDREWFRENREIYEREIRAPFADIITALTPFMKELDPQIICDPKKVSRIFRDARIARGGPIFRQSIWCSMMRPKEQFISKPEFYVGISTDGFGWGCGYYKTPNWIMEIIRELILNGDRTAKAALKAYSKQDRFSLYGEMYKRDRYPDRSEEEKQWLDRKSLSVSFESDDPELYFSKDIEKAILEDFKTIADIYRLFAKAEDIYTERKANR